MAFLFLLLAAAILACVVLGYSVAWALTFGFLLFFLYDVKKGNQPKELLLQSWNGICRVRNVFVNYLLVGMMTALWRVCGTIPFLIFHSVRLLNSQMFILLSFLLCAAFSVLTGTAFGSVSTVGVICMTIGSSLGLNPAFLGGAILAGVRFGDRCSPVSTSALLISEVTGTHIYDNIKNMVRTAAVPFLTACAVYFLIGRTMNKPIDMEDTLTGISSYFSLSWLCALPAVAVIVMACFRIPVRKLFVSNIVLSLGIALLCERTAPAELFSVLVKGFHPSDPQLSATLGGGGVLSILPTLSIVLISSTYMELFKAGKFFDGLSDCLKCISQKVGPFGVVLPVAVLIAVISCNQTLTIMLTAQICAQIMPDRSHMASALADSASVIPALVPWSVACALPLAVIGAPTGSILYACYIYLLPVCHFYAQKYVRE